MQGTAIAHDEQTGGNMSSQANGRAFEIVRDDAIPKPVGKLVDERGETIQPALPTTFMSRLNERSKDDFTVTKGMAGIIAIGLTAIGIFLGYIVPQLRQDARETGANETKVVEMQKDIGETRQDMKDLNNKFDKLNESLREQQRFIDRMGSFQGGVTAGEGQK